MAASSAATQIMPEAMRDSVCGSGPTPRGNSTQARTKKTTAIRLSIPCRIESRTSRRTIIRAPLSIWAFAVRSRVRASSGRSPPCSAITTMPPPSRWRLMALIQPTLGIGIEPGARLIQQPQRRRRHQQAGERQPPLLSGR